MPQIRIVQCPSSVAAGAAFTVDVVVENSAAQQHVRLELRRFDLAAGTGPWSATAVIGSSGRGEARFTGVTLSGHGQANLKCSSTTHLCIPDARSVLVHGAGGLA